MNKIKILFVDDEPNVLSGLRRMLYPMRKEWDMTFVDNSAEALSLVKEKSFDVVVADMRMPVMSGADLLTRISKIQPRVVRIILSGHSDKEMIMQTVPVTHQFLTKPCSPDKLKNVIQRCMALRNLFKDKSLLDVVGRVKSLPSLPDIYIQLKEEIRSDKATPKSIGDIISKDVAMSAKVLQMVNSAFFALVRKVSSIEQAVVYLGLDTIRFLVLGMHIFNKLEKLKIGKFSLKSQVKHSLEVASMVSSLCKFENLPKDVQEIAFFAGLFHDCGVLILAQNMPKEYEEAVNFAEEKRLCLYLAELDVFGVSHAEIGAYLLNIWGLPEEMVRAAAFHHNPMAAYSSRLDCLSLVHIADRLEHLKSPMNVVGPVCPVDKDLIEKFGIQDKFISWRDLLVKEKVGE
ncbi:HDOD domain-containing protein [Desulfohalobiaceae bacterium Ax17]|jgi:putative nucleotidyltransferase with HDIG domain|uniref:response regulator n=1 Tax=Desulfovulcanus ferrireducens TaxID=2831190 RepID=UPI00207BBA38|nr:response regulator [Desulfovulcanus ferrireducens]MBT8763852.1 HDOD domain-containing protein [Desulfovulcanus ferrireducens]